MIRHRTDPRRAASWRAVPVWLAVLALVALTAGACTTNRGLTGPTWQLTGTTEKVPASQTVVPDADQSRYTVTFANDGTASIKADCNTVGATWTTSGTQLNITLGPSTLVACPDDSIADQFVLGLDLATSFNVHGTGLTLYLGNEGTMEFTAAG